MVHYVHIFLLALLILQIWLIGQTRGQNGYIREPIAAASPSHHHSHSRLTLSIDFIYSSISSLNSNFKLQRYGLVEYPIKIPYLLFSQMGSRPLEDGVYFITNDRHRNHALTSLDNNAMAMEMASSRWRLQFDPASGAYECTHLNSGLVLDLEGGRGEPGTNIITYPAHGGQNQRWKIEQLDQGYVAF